MSWQNILKAPRKKQLSDDMRKVARALLSLSDDKLEEGVVDFVNKKNMSIPKILEAVTRLDRRLREGYDRDYRNIPRGDYFNEEPFNIKNVYENKSKLSPFMNKLSKIETIIKSIDKEGNIIENSKIIKKLYEDEEYDKMVQYLNGEISFDRLKFQHQKELVETKKEVNESGIEKRLKNFSSLLKNNKSARQKLLNAEAFSKPEVVGYKIEKGTIIVLPVDSEEIDSIIDNSGLKLKPVIPVVKNKDGKMMMEGKDITATLSSKIVREGGVGRVGSKKSKGKAKERARKDEDPKSRKYLEEEISFGKIAFGFTGFPEYVTREQILPFAGGVVLDSNFKLPSFEDESKETTLDLDMIENFKTGKKISVNRTPIAKVLQLQPYIEFRRKPQKSQIIAGDRKTISKPKTISRDRKINEEILIEYFYEVMRSGAKSAKKQEQLKFLKGTGKWFRYQIGNFDSYIRVFDIFFDNKNSKELESVLDSILKTETTSVKTNVVLEKLKTLASLNDRDRIRSYVDMDDDIIDFLTNEYKRIKSKGSVSNIEWYKIIKPSNRDDEDTQDIKTRLLDLLPEIEESLSGTLTISEDLRNAILYYIELLENDKKIPLPDTIDRIYFVEVDEVLEDFLPKETHKNIKTILESMVLSGDVYSPRKGIASKPKQLLTKIKQELDEEEEAGTTPDIEVNEYVFTTLFEKFAKFCKGLDSNLNGNKNLNDLYNKIDKNKNEKIDADENAEAPLRDFRRQVLLRYNDMRKALLKEIQESVIQTLEENTLRSKTTGGTKGVRFEPLTWLKGKGLFE
jgi:hypothetical protein